MRVLFVCTGNTCRSPMAEGYLRSKGIPDLMVESRGLSADLSPISENSRLALLEKNIDMTNHISKCITLSDISWADKIICLSQGHKNLLQDYIQAEKLSVLGNGISDPYMGDIYVYRKCRDEIFDAIDKLIENGFFSVLMVREAYLNDVSAIAKLESICFSEPWSEKVIEDAMNNGTKFYVAVYNGEIVGYMGISCILDEGYITNVAVFPEKRGKGIGYELVSHCLNKAKEEKLSFVSLEVRVSNKAAISLYEKLGFKAVGKRKGFYRSPVEDAIIMTVNFVY